MLPTRSPLASTSPLTEQVVVDRHADGRGLEPLPITRSPCLSWSHGSRTPVRSSDRAFKAANCSLRLPLPPRCWPRSRRRLRYGMAVPPASASVPCRCREPPSQIDDPGTLVQGHGTEPASLVVAGREINAGTISLADVAVQALQNHLTTGTVACRIVEGDGRPATSISASSTRVRSSVALSVSLPPGSITALARLRLAPEGQLALEPGDSARLGGRAGYIDRPTRRGCGSPNRPLQ